MKIKQSKLAEVARLFFKLGCIAFGGPAAHIDLMEHKVIQKRRWITKQHFPDLIGATNLIPGPNSTEMTMHCGYERTGIPGLFVAGVYVLFAYLDSELVVKGLMNRAPQSDWRGIVIAGTSAAVTFRLKKNNSAWIVLGGAVMGFLLDILL